MPSLRLSNPFRRGADRPSLKQRAAALKATATRVMKGRSAGEVTDQPQGESLPSGSVVEQGRGAFPALKRALHNPVRDPAKVADRNPAEGAGGAQRESDMGRHESFENATPVAEDMLSSTMLGRNAAVPVSNRAAPGSELDAAVGEALADVGLTSEVSEEICAAIEDHRDAIILGRAEPVDSDEAFDRHVAAQDAADFALRTVPCRSLADLRAKLTYLVPLIAPDMLDSTHVEHLKALQVEVDRLCRERSRLSGDDADQYRWALKAGSIAAEVPSPAFAAPAAIGAHPDQALLDVYASLEHAREIEAAADEAYRVASRAVDAVLDTCPAALRPTRWEHASICASPFKPVWGWMYFRCVPAAEDDESQHRSSAAWTGDMLRKVIALAVPTLGWGGQTPHRVRRWKLLLPIADAFDARVAAVELALDYRRLETELAAARKVVTALTADVSGRVAATPEGMAALVRVIAEYPWKDSGNAWPNLLRSAANVSGVPLVDLEHRYASLRQFRDAEA